MTRRYIVLPGRRGFVVFDRRQRRVFRRFAFSGIARLVADVLNGRAS